MKRLTIISGLILSLAGGLEMQSALAISPEIFAKAETQPTQSVNLIALEAQAQNLYETGKLADAIDLLEQISTRYATQRDRFAQARTLRNLALVYYQAGEREKATTAISESVNRLQEVENNSSRTKLWAQILEVQGQLELSRGQPEKALDIWKQAADRYHQVDDRVGVTRSQLNQAQALQGLGLYNQAIKTLKAVKESLQNQPDSLLKAKGFQSLGDALRVVGDLSQAEAALQTSLAIAEHLQAKDALSATLMSLGNLARVQDKTEDAFKLYERAIETATNPQQLIEAKLNYLSLSVDRKTDDKSSQVLDKSLLEIESLLQGLEPSRMAVYARINFAKSLQKLAQNTGDRTFISQVSKTAELLATAIQVARNLKDVRAEAYALGNLGKLYEERQQWKEARELTERSLLLAQTSSAADISYQWQWQLGRILKAQGEKSGAIAAYSSAVKTLQSLRSDLATISSDVQFSFQESVEPVYREFVALLLQPGVPIEQVDLMQARQVIESLQVAELDNFFRDACLDVKPVAIDSIDPKAAVVYPIILGDRLEVIVRLPGQPLRHYTSAVSEVQVEETVNQLRVGLTRGLVRRVYKQVLEPSQQIYSWLIRPIEQELATSGVTTLVFVLDGSLRNIPMGVLHDGQQYLAQKYNLAVAPGLQLVDARPIKPSQLKILAGGLSESRQGFNALPGVETELKQIGNTLSSQQLVNSSFTEANLREKVNALRFPVIHLATHGQFSSQANDTFILTWDERINAKELDNLLRGEKRTERSIELLVLSACRTAIGDKRASLGLAGVAVRAGARSTLASLWYVNDEATTLLMTRFYEELAKNNVTKAEALRRAQQSLLQDENFSHPYFWAAFVLVGNWL